MRMNVFDNTELINERNNQLIILLADVLRIIINFTTLTKRAAILALIDKEIAKIIVQPNQDEISADKIKLLQYIREPL